MGNPYTEVTVANYNATPPSDDGQQVAANEVEWAKHKDKLGDPLKTAIEATQTNVTAAFAKRFGNSTVATAVNLTVTTAQDGKFVEGSGTITITLPASATASEGFLIGVGNTGTGTVTVDPDGTETMNAFTTIGLTPQEFIWLSSDGTNWTIIDRGFLEGVALPRGNIDGLVISNDSTDTDHDIEFAIGECRDADNAANITLSTAITKQIDNNWTEGDDLGGFPSGLTLSASTTYHAFVISKTDGTTDAGFDTSLTATNLLADATGYTRYRRVGSVVTDGSSNIRGFFQIGDHFFWDSRVNDYNVTNPGTSASSRTLTVPTGIEVIAHMNSLLRDVTPSNNNFLLISSLDGTDQTPSTTIFTNAIENSGGIGVVDAAEVFVKTNTSGQVRTRNSNSNTDIIIRGGTIGWIDPRGKNS